MIPLNEKTKMRYKREKGHVYIELPIICEGSTEEDAITFVYDTGAYLTVINKERYEWFGLDKLPRWDAKLGSYSGSSEGYMFQIPGLMVGQKLLTGVWAFSPKNDNSKQNLLGDNVIEYFNPYQDNTNDCFYFIDNSCPEPYVSPDNGFSLACDSIMLIEEMKK